MPDWVVIRFAPTKDALSVLFAGRTVVRLLAVRTGAPCERLFDISTISQGSREICKADVREFASIASVLRPSTTTTNTSPVVSDMRRFYFQPEIDEASNISRVVW
ncbi:MAG: hypothetical protein EOP06_26390 [Proteobacteria bacterium]|nr:MAG: hypothetical protein EOP06_26390 [Pseudomonadota bacterium]